MAAHDAGTASAVSEMGVVADAYLLGSDDIGAAAWPVALYQKSACGVPMTRGLQFSHSTYQGCTGDVDRGR